MSKTPFSDKCQIIANVSDTFSDSDDPMWQEYFATYNLGVPLAMCVHFGGADANDRGRQWIEDAWIAMCEVLGIDHHGEYENALEMMELATEQG